MVRRTFHKALAVYPVVKCQRTRVIQTKYGVIVVIYIVPVCAVFRGEHGVLHRLVYAAEAHQINVVSRNLVDIEMQPFLGLEFGHQRLVVNDHLAALSLARAHGAVYPCSHCQQCALCAPCLARLAAVVGIA